MGIEGRRKQVAVWHAEDAHQKKHLVFPNAMQTALQLGHRAARDIPARNLQLGGELALRPVSVHPQFANLRPDDVVD